MAGLLGGSAAALEPPPPSLDFPSNRPLDVSDPLPEETARDPLALPPIPAPHWSSLPATLRVFVAEIAVEGNSVLPEEVVAGAVALYVGRELDTADLEALRESSGLQTLCCWLVRKRQPDPSGSSFSMERA